MKTTILVTGANGQIGSVLVPHLQEIFGYNNVIASDFITNPRIDSIFEKLDATNAEKLHEIVTKYKINQIYHLAAILSAKGEENPLLTWNTNMITLMNVLEIARINRIDKVFFPSSIAVFGDLAEKNNTPQSSFLNPATVYGISKASGEIWAQYYCLKYGLDIRSLRFPGIISYQSAPGGGTTDYAVDIYHKAVLNKKFSYNLAAVSYAPKDVALSIKKYFPGFEIEYVPDNRQAIADKWPRLIDDQEAKKDWNWKHEFNLDAITKTMLTALSDKYKGERYLEAIDRLVS